MCGNDKDKNCKSLFNQWVSRVVKWGKEVWSFMVKWFIIVKDKIKALFTKES